MMNNDKFISQDALRKRNARKNETNTQRETRLTKQREISQRKKARETAEEKEAQAARDKERKRAKLAMETDEQREKRLEYSRTYMKRVAQNRTTRQKRAREEAEEQDESASRDKGRKRVKLTQNRKQKQPQQETRQDAVTRRHDEPLPANMLSEPERNLLKNFRNKVDKFEHNGCPTCNESFPSITLVKGECRRCYTEKGSPKKFSTDNNMDPGEVPEELQGLTEIEEMLIARVFPVMSVYKLRGGQHGYRGNVINFPQDVQEFATKLPRSPSSLEVLVVRRQSASNSEAYREFRVRRVKVARALNWLKDNNRYYADIIIDNEVLRSLPINDSVDKQLQDISDDENDDDVISDIENEANDDDVITRSEKDDDVITRSFVPLLPSGNREDAAIKETLDRVQEGNHSNIAWPQINSNPVNEFQTSGYIACAFPSLYPTGSADLRAERIRDIKPAEYFKHLLLYKDGRFARHSRWRYFALNSQMRWRALQEGKVYVRQNLTDTQITVTDIQEKITQGDNHIANRIMRFGEGLRGSRQFWNARRSELTDMIKQIGTQGLIFFTFSAADLQWPELHKLMPSSGDAEASAKRHHQNIVDNPHIAVWFFNKRFEIFFNDVLKKQWDLEDWWYRFEWQHRGSVHVHGIGKIKNAPIIDWEQMKEDENKMNEVIQYLDKLVTTINPGLDMPVPERHPCQKNRDELRDDLQDYVDLINKVQRHTRCSPVYCLRINREGKQFCRFGFPKETTEKTIVQDDGHGQLELVTARNDQYINPHNRLQLQGWRANVDLKPILSIHAALQYISKYASKAEPQSAAFSDILNRILDESQPEDSPLAPVQKLLLHSVAERDISAQETCHIILGIPLYHSSRQSVFLNLDKEAPRWIQGTGEGEGYFTINNDLGLTEKSPLKIYWERPTELEDFTLFRLYLTHKLVKNQWKKCQQENIVRMFPRPSSLREGPQWEEFCRVKVLLHVRHRNLQQLIGDGSIAWTTVYHQHIEEINSDPIDLLGQPVDNEREIIDEDEGELIEDDEQDDYRLDWMVLSGMGPNSNINCSTDLGTRDIDRDHDWINDLRKRYSNTDLADVDTFVSRNCGISEAEVGSVEYQTLNDNQMVVFKRIEAHYHDLLSGHQVEPLRIIVMGTAGTGKTYLIKAIRSRLQEMTGDGSESPIVVLAPTGVAAFNIDGATIHSKLSLPIKHDNLELKGEKLKKLQDKLKNVRYVIIDEKSMVGRRMLALIDKRLRHAFPEHKNKPFGNRSVILFGDFGQIPPVLDLPMFAKSKRDALSNSGLAAYKHFKEAYKLNVVQRQSGNSKEQQEFRNILLRLRNGESTIDDWKTLTTRIDDKLSAIKRNRFSNAMFILTNWTEVNAVNLERLRSLNVPVAKIKAIHTGSSEAKKADSDTANGLEAELLLARGTRVMLTVNLQTEAGLVNGSMGTVQDILFEEDQGPPYLPIAVLISFDNYKGHTICSLEGERVVPIAPVRRTWNDNSNLSCSRLQIPVRLAWAITVHKSQGLTLKKAIIDLGKSEFVAGLSFVAVSRVRALEDIIFKPFSFERLQRVKESKRLEERIKEENRLISMIPKVKKNTQKNTQ